MAQLTVRYFASARAAAGTAEETITADSVDQAVSIIQARHDNRLATVLSACSLLLNGVAVSNPSAPLPADAELDVLPPFAGG